MPAILQVSESSATTDGNGLANIVPSAGGFAAPLKVDVAVMAGGGAILDYPLELLPSLSTDSTGTTPTSVGGITAPVRGTLRIQEQQNRTSMAR